MKKPSPQKIMAVINSWLKMYDFQWNRQSDPEIKKAWFGVFSNADPEMLQDAFKQAFENSEYYPTPDNVKGYLKSPQREGTAWIPPHGGECRADAFQGMRMGDGREIRCACRSCRPDLGWCKWKFSDGSFCDRLSRNRNPYCPQHHHMASEHFDISTLDIGQQVEYLKDLDRQGLLLFTSDVESPVVRGYDLGPCANKHEFQKCLYKLRSMTKLGGVRTTSGGAVDRPAGKAR